MTFVPELGSLLTTIFLPLTQGLTGAESELILSTYKFSDSQHLYVQTVSLGLFALFISVLLSARFREKLLPWLRTSVAYILTFFLLKYGIEKWTYLQFPVPPPNILHAEVGSLDKDILFWSLMGTSKVYAGFMGAIEIIAALLLLSGKTRLIGGYISFGVFLNILALNTGFDITVKLLSFTLLMCAFYIISDSMKPLVQFLTSSTLHPISTKKLQLTPPFKRLLKAVVLLVIILESILPVLNRPRNTFASNNISSQSFVIKDSHVLPNCFQGFAFERIHINSSGFLVAETNDGNFHSFTIHLIDGSNSFKLIDEQVAINVKKHGNDWLFSKGDTLVWRCERIKNEALPLLQDSFHLTVEGMVH